MASRTIAASPRSQELFEELEELFDGEMVADIYNVLQSYLAALMLRIELSGGPTTEEAMPAALTDMQNSVLTFRLMNTPAASEAKN